MEKVTLNVQGMSCGHCVRSVEGSVRELDGVNEVKVHLEAGKVTLHLMKTKVSLEGLKKQLMIKDTM